MASDGPNNDWFTTLDTLPGIQSYEFFSFPDDAVPYFDPQQLGEVDLSLFPPLSPLAGIMAPLPLPPAAVEVKEESYSTPSVADTSSPESTPFSDQEEASENPPRKKKRKRNGSIPNSLTYNDKIERLNNDIQKTMDLIQEKPTLALYDKGITLYTKLLEEISHQSDKAEGRTQKNALSALKSRRNRTCEALKQARKLFVAQEENRKLATELEAAKNRIDFLEHQLEAMSTGTFSANQPIVHLYSSQTHVSGPTKIVVSPLKRSSSEKLRGLKKTT